MTCEERFVHGDGDTPDAMILAGGKGTRLRRVVDDRPKPMAEVAGRPFVEWLLPLLYDQGTRRVVLCTGHLASHVQAYFGDGQRWNMELRYSCDPFPLGTGGAVRQALDEVRGDRFLVLNGDSYCRFDLGLLLRTHLNAGARATLWLVEADDRRRYGSVRVGADGTVESFAEKSSEFGTGLVNAGVYLIERGAAETIPTGRAVSLENDFFPALVGQGLCAVVGGDPFTDIGTPESYAGAGEFLAGEGYTW
jgi:NDP-sugar pyrophosphorylase family protein